MIGSKYCMEVLRKAAAVLLCAAAFIGAYALPGSGNKGVITAYAFEQPENIELYIDEVTVDKKDIGDDTVIEVPVSIKNNPGFLALNIVCELDKTLEYDDYIEAYLINEDISNISTYKCRGTDKVVAVDIMSMGTTKLTGDGELVFLRVKLPKDISEGYYPINFTEEYKDGVFNILTANSFDASFGIECFSKLESGGIKVIDSSKPEYILGDVKGDGNVDIEDAVMVISHVNGQKALTDDETKRADVDGNGDVDIEDAVAIISHVNGVKTLS